MRREGERERGRERGRECGRKEGGMYNIVTKKRERREGKNINHKQHIIEFSSDLS